VPNPKNCALPLTRGGLGWGPSKFWQVYFFIIYKFAKVACHSRAAPAYGMEGGNPDDNF